MFSEEPRLLVHDREVPGREGGKVGEAVGRREREVGPERLHHLGRCEVVEPHLEDEPAQGGGVEVLADCIRVQEGRRSERGARIGRIGETRAQGCR